MCGISGIFKYHNTSASDKKLSYHLNRMNKILAHRGPDDKGVVTLEQETVGLAQTRLSILDLSQAGHQPMVDNTTGNVITYNGEIFNYLDINKEYFNNEHFISNTDTETLLKLFRQNHLKMFNHINGMFAFGLWNNEKKELLLARDPSGKKPLYYTEMGGFFVFSSEIKAILSLPWIKKELDEKALYNFLTYNSVIPPATMFKNIYKFNPGHYMVVNKNGIETYQPFHILKKILLPSQNENDIANLILENLKTSVNKRMISDVPVGAFLSGGVDSSAIVALMRDNTQKEIKTFTIGFKDQPDYNELQYSEKVSKMFDTTHYEKIVGPNDLLEMINVIVDIYDEPQADTTAIPIYFISQLAHEQNIKVVLNGDGPDELFAGYNNYLRYAKMEPYFRTLKSFPKFLRSIASNTLGVFDRQSPAYEISCRLKNDQVLFWPGATSIKESFKKELLTSSFSEQFANYSSYSYVEQLEKDFFQLHNKDSKTDIIDWMSFSGYKYADIERFLFRSDRLGMANSIEARSPFLNIDMVEFALSIPSHLKIKNGIPKYILKKSLENILPPSILYRKKMGFCLPIQEWAGNYITDYVLKNVDSFTSNTGFFSKETIIKWTSELQNGKTNNTNTVWTFYFLMNWFDKWM